MLCFTKRRKALRWANLVSQMLAHRLLVPTQLPMNHHDSYQYVWRCKKPSEIYRYIYIRRRLRQGERKMLTAVGQWMHMVSRSESGKMLNIFHIQSTILSTSTIFNVGNQDESSSSPKFVHDFPCMFQARPPAKSFPHSSGHVVPGAGS